MDRAIYGGDSGAADAPSQSPIDRSDEVFCVYSDVEDVRTVQERVASLDGQFEPFVESDDDLDPPSPEVDPAPVDLVSRDVEPGADQQDLGGLLEIVWQSVTVSVDGWVESIKKGLVVAAAEYAVPGIGGHLADLAFEVKEVMASVHALDSEDPVLQVPLPSPVAGLGFTLEVPLASGREGNADRPLALCIAPDTPSLTGGWALDAPEEDERPDTGGESQPEAEWLPDDAEEEELERKLERRRAVSPRWDTADREQQELPAVNPSAACYVVETDLGAVPLLKRKKLRAWELYVLAREYAPQLRESLDPGRIEVLIIADRQRRCGLWIWLRSDSETTDHHR